MNLVIHVELEVPTIGPHILPCNSNNPYLVTIYIYRISGMWFGVTFRKQTPKRHLFERDWTFVQNMKLEHQHKSRGPVWPFNEHKNVHFNDEQIYI